MHVNDFRSDLAPTRSQYRRIAEGLLALSGEAAPADRQAATELILRIEAEPPAEEARNLAELASDQPTRGLHGIYQEPTDPAIAVRAATDAVRAAADRLGGRRAAARPGGVA